MATIVAASGGGPWGTASTWTGSVVPTAADDVQLGSGSGDVSINLTTNVCRSLDCTGYTGTLTHNWGAKLSIGDATPGAGNKALTFVTGMTFAIVNSLDAEIAFVSTSTTQQTITTAGKTLGSVKINGTGSSYILGDNIKLTDIFGLLSILNGTLSASTFVIDTGGVLVNGANATITLGSATHLLTGRISPDPWEVVSGTVNANTSTLKITDGSYFSKTFKGGGKTYNNVWFSGTGDSDSRVIRGSNTFATLTDSNTAAHSLFFEAGTTQTVTNFIVSGASTASRVSIDTEASTATHALVKSGGGTVSCDYLNIQHSVATPIKTWYAGANSVNNQSVATAGSGWRFTVVPPALPALPASTVVSGMPTLTVEVSFTTDSLDTDPAWVDIAGYVRSGSVRSGRTNELDEFQTGSCSLTLDNRARTFDPLYTSGPYYGYLKARMLCRISATYGATTYRLFQGFVSGWTLSPDLSGDSVCQIEGYDGLSYLAGVDLPIDLYTHMTERRLAGVPIAWWQLGASDSLATDKMGTYNYTYTTATPTTGDAPSKWMGGSSSAFDGSYGVIGPAVATVAADWSVTGFFNTETAGPTGYVNPILANAGPDNATIGIDDSGRLVFRNSSAGAVNSGLPGNDGKWHHFAITYPGSGASPKCYVDGIDLSFDRSGSGDNGTGWQLIGLSNHAGDATAFTGSLSHIACWDIELDSTEIGLLAAAGLRGVPSTGETTIDWVEEVLSASGWPGAWTGLEVGTVKPGGMKWGQNALTVLQQLALTEGGRVFVDQNGDFLFYNRSHDFTATRSTTSQATYSDSGLAAVVPFSAVGEISYSDAYLSNSVTVTTAEELAFTATDATSITTYGTVAKQIDTLLDSQADAQTYADIYLLAYKDPSLRIQDWKVNPLAKGATAFPKILDARLADRVTFEILPNSLGSRISQQMIVEQISHDFTPDTWTTTFSGSPASAAWLLEDATYGLLESTTILG